jgi:hypothetical protein
MSDTAVSEPIEGSAPAPATEPAPAVITAEDGTTYLRADTAAPLSPVEQNFRASAEKNTLVRMGALDPTELHEQKAVADLEEAERTGRPLPPSLTAKPSNLTDSAVIELDDKINALEARVAALEAK